MAHRIRSILLIGVLGVVGACAGEDDDDGAPAATASATTTTVDAAPSTDPPSDTTRSLPDGTDPPGAQPEGFTTVTVRITEPDGEICEVCMWLADDADERGRGLMGVTDLGEPVGMAFVFPQPVEGAFYMFSTPTPLSIAWFAPDGAFVSASEMEPCLSSDSGECPRFRAAGTYQLAVEVFEGGLDELGIEPGSAAVVLADTESAGCALAAAAADGG